MRSSIRVEGIVSKREDLHLFSAAAIDLCNRFDRDIGQSLPGRLDVQNPDSRGSRGRLGHKSELVNTRTVTVSEQDLIGADDLTGTVHHLSDQLGVVETSYQVAITVTDRHQYGGGVGELHRLISKAPGNTLWEDQRFDIGRLDDFDLDLFSQRLGIGRQGHFDGSAPRGSIGTEGGSVATVPAFGRAFDKGSRAVHDSKGNVCIVDWPVQPIEQVGDDGGFIFTIRQHHGVVEFNRERVGSNQVDGDRLLR